MVKRRGADRDDVVADQHRADEALALAEQPVDDRGAQVAVVLERQHAGPRGGREGGLGAGEEGREHERQDDDRGGEPEIDLERFFHRVLERDDFSSSRHPLYLFA